MAKNAQKQKKLHNKFTTPVFMITLIKSEKSTSHSYLNYNYDKKNQDPNC